MRAVGVREFGGTPGILDVPVPIPAAGEIRVRLEAAGINPFDWKISDGLFRDTRPHVFPLILGVDGAGTIDAVGANVRRFRVGDRIFGQFLHDPVGRGTYAEHVVVPEGNALVTIPAGISSPDAAGIPTAGMAAMDSLDMLRLERGNTVLVVGASGGIGSFAVPLAAAAGIRVLAVARSSAHARLRSIGASATIDAESPDAMPEVLRQTPAGVDALLDMADATPAFVRWAGAVRPGGAAVSTTYAASDIAGLRTMNLDLQPRAELLERLGRAIAAGSLHVPVERIISLAEVPPVVAEGRAGRFSGKTVIRLAGHET